MAYLLRVYNGNDLSEKDITELSDFWVGCGNTGGVDIPDSSLKKKHIRFKLSDTRWNFEAAKPVVASGKPVLSGTLALGEIVVLNVEKNIAAAIYEAKPDYCKLVELSGKSSIVVGRSSSCDISVNCPQISGKHLELNRNDIGWFFRDLDSSNGTYYNGTRTAKAGLSSGDTLDIGLCRLIVVGDQLTVAFDGSIKVNIAQRQEVRSLQAANGEYPYAFKRSPRLLERLPEGEIEFQAPPTVGIAPSISWLSVLLPPLSTVAIMLAVCFLLGGAMTMLYFSVPMTLVGLLMSIINYRSQKKKYRQTEQLRLDKYGEYLNEKKSEIEEKQNHQRRILSEIYPPVSECVGMAQELSRRLWERKPGDDDFMALRLGDGEADFGITFRLPRQVLTMEEDALASRPHKMADTYQKVEHCPIVCSFKRNPSCGLIGDRQSCVTLTKNLLVEAAMHHSYDELNIVIACGEEERAEWDFARWLPHIFDNTRGKRYFVDNAASAKRIFSELEEIFFQRQSDCENLTDPKKNKADLPFYFLICTDAQLMEHQSIMKYLAANDTNLGIGTLFLFDSLEKLPKECGGIMETHGRKGVIYYKNNASVKTEFIMDALRPEQYEDFARALAPVRVDSVFKEKTLPVSISFLQGYHARQPREIDIASNWQSSRPEQSMAVPIGVRAGGETFEFDIHEKRCGPHGLVAGMTGSGKSEMIQSWILSMALKFSPQDVSFVLIDFKGTGLILPFQNLPHLAGTISDLDTNITRNLLALENELTRRKALLDEYGVSNISGYLKLYRQGKAREPLSYLFVIIDEFAEFKALFPDFMQVINRIFSIGRTLGVHIILLTQKPSSVVDDKMNANTRFRWCLKVASSADSKDMLRKPDAARITNPGRCFVLVGEDEVYEQVQSYWSGAPYNPYRDLSLQRSTKVSVVNLYGTRVSYEPEKTTGFRSERNEIDALVDYMDNYTRKNDISRAKNIWTKKLASEIELEQVLQIAFDGEHWNENENTLCPAVGMIDDPRSQSQYPLKLNFSENGHTAVYGAPGSGKTTFLQSAVMSLALSYSPEMVSLYLLDFGGGSLNLFRNLPHVGGVVLDHEEEKIEKWSRLIALELERRKKRFAEIGVVSIDSYREASGDKLPYIVIVLDNFAPVLNLYPKLDVFFQNLTREGGSYGIYLLVTAGAQTAVSYRISQNITCMLALQMADKADYAAIVGKTDGMEPESLPGRGLLKGKPPLEFQTALPAAGKTENQRITKIRSLVALMNQKWTGKRPASIPVMPEIIRAGDYKTEGIFVGLSCETIEPVSVSLKEKHCLCVSAALGCDSHALWQALVSQIPAKLSGAEIAVYESLDSRIPNMENAVISHFTSADDFDRYIAGLMPVLQKRKDAAQSGNISPEDKKPLVVGIGDLKSCFDSVSNDTVRRLSNIVNLGGGLSVYLLVLGRCDEIAKLYHGGDTFTLSLVEKSNALLEGGSFQKHGAFSGNLSYSEASAELSGQEGYLLSDSRALKIKLVQFL